MGNMSHIILVVKSNMKHYIPYDIMPKGIFQECLLDIRFRWTKVSRIKAPDLAFRISLIHGFIHHHDHSSTPPRKFRLEVRHLESYRGENPMICTILVSLLFLIFSLVHSRTVMVRVRFEFHPWRKTRITIVQSWMGNWNLTNGKQHKWWGYIFRKNPL